MRLPSYLDIKERQITLNQAVVSSGKVTIWCSSGVEGDENSLRFEEFRLMTERQSESDVGVTKESLLDTYYIVVGLSSICRAVDCWPEGLVLYRSSVRRGSVKLAK